MMEREIEKTSGMYDNIGGAENRCSDKDKDFKIESQDCIGE